MNKNDKKTENITTNGSISKATTPTWKVERLNELEKLQNKGMYFLDEMSKKATLMRTIEKDLLLLQELRNTEINIADRLHTFFCNLSIGDLSTIFAESDPILVISKNTEPPFITNAGEVPHIMPKIQWIYTKNERCEICEYDYKPKDNRCESCRYNFTPRKEDQMLAKAVVEIIQGEDE